MPKRKILIAKFLKRNFEPKNPRFLGNRKAYKYSITHWKHAFLGEDLNTDSLQTISATAMQNQGIMTRIMVKHLLHQHYSIVCVMLELTIQVYW